MKTAERDDRSLRFDRVKALFALALAACVVGCGDESSDEGNAGGSGGTEAAGMSEFGKLCETDTDCTGPTNYCAAPPMQTKFCTADMASCDEAAETCPEGWPCLDLNMFGIPRIICERR